MAGLYRDRGRGNHDLRGVAAILLRFVICPVVQNGVAAQVVATDGVTNQPLAVTTPARAFIGRSWWSGDHGLLGEIDTVRDTNTNIRRCRSLRPELLPRIADEVVEPHAVRRANAGRFR